MTFHGSSALTNVMNENPDLTLRLRRLGQEPVGAATGSAHLTRIATVPERGRRTGPRLVVGAVAVTGLLAATTGLVAAGVLPGGGVPRAQVRTVADEGADDVGDPEAPPPGTDADVEGAAVRPAPFADDPCKGPPPFAGTRPEGDSAAERDANRQAEAEAFAAQRAESCPSDPPPGEDADPTGPPPGTPPGPPAGVAPGPPDGTPSGPPDGTPTGPPAGMPPEGARQGPPEGNPPGPPAGTPSGPPVGTASRPPVDPPPPSEGRAGPPDGVPPGPPAGR